MDREEDPILISSRGVSGFGCVGPIAYCDPHVGFMRMASL